MDCEKRFSNIHTFLKEHSALFQKEPMDEFPFSESLYTKWAQKISDQRETLLQGNLELFIESENCDQLKSFLRQIIDLTNIPFKEIEKKDLEKNLLRKVTTKKQHEISVLKPFIDSLKIRSMIDIGAGQGHLSSFIAKKNQVISIDKDKKLQESGIKRLKKWKPELLENITFIKEEICLASKFNFNYDRPSLLVGLHACGPLSSDLIKSLPQKDIHFFLNFGCCFHKMQESDYNLSSVAKKSPLTFSNHAKTLAAKSFKQLTKEDILKKDKVKRLRYSLHFFQHGHSIKPCPIGNIHSKDLELNFSDFAYHYDQRLKEFSKEYLDIFFNSKENQKNITIALNLGALRECMGRAIELYFILDRVLYLQEMGYQTSLHQYFDTKLSPRNLGIFAKK